MPQPPCSQLFTNSRCRRFCFTSRQNFGTVAFHDIVEGVEVHVGGVPKFWREVKQNRRHREFVKSWEQGGWGIGVLPEFGA